jgi:hypothetical protein
MIIYVDEMEAQEVTLDLNTYVCYSLFGVENQGGAHMHCYHCIRNSILLDTNTRLYMSAPWSYS